MNDLLHPYKSWPHIDGLVQERHNSSALVFLALTHHYVQSVLQRMFFFIWNTWKKKQFFNFLGPHKLNWQLLTNEPCFHFNKIAFTVWQLHSSFTHFPRSNYWNVSNANSLFIYKFPWINYDTCQIKRIPMSHNGFEPWPQHRVT